MWLCNCAMGLIGVAVQQGEMIDAIFVTCYTNIRSFWPDGKRKHPSIGSLHVIQWCYPEMSL